MPIPLRRSFACLTFTLFPAVTFAAATMQAAVVIDGKVQVQSVPIPEPSAGEVRIKVHAAAVNPADWKRAARTAGQPASTAPPIPGWDVAGTIDAAGPMVTEWKAGDAVIAFFEAYGGYAEYAVAPVGMIAAKPSNMSFEEAAGVPLVAITAWKALIDAGHLASGQRVLIHGGAGGVGSAAVQLAKARGAYVIATASPRNHDFLRSIGADEVIDYNAVEFEDVLDDLDMVVNTVDASTGERSLEVLKPGGMMVSVVGPTAAEKCAAANVRCAISDRRTGTPLGEVLAEFVKLAEAGQFRIHVDATFPLAEAAKAWDLNRQGHTRGKIVLLVSN